MPDSGYRATANNGEWFEYKGYNFLELARQEYAGNRCIFAAGLLKGHPLDAYYLWLEKDGVDEPTIILLMPDELAALAWLCGGALWSHLIQERTNAQ